MSSADWLKEAVIYEAFPRAFGPNGNLAEITQRIPHIADLGATVLWLMPIHPIGRKHRKGSMGSPYSISDFRAVNPDYGTEADFVDLVTAAHEAGMRVLIDWVGNHAAWDTVPMEHPGWVARDEHGEVLLGSDNWPDTVKLDYDNKDLCAYMIESMAYWLERFDIDGFRCDVAGRVPLVFWERARKVLEQVRPDIGMLAESYKSDLTERAFELAYDNRWYRAVKEVVGKQLSGRRIWKAQRSFDRIFPSHARPLRYIDNHDQRRAVELFGVEGAKSAAVLLFCSEGVPLVYNGQEMGDTTPSQAPWLFEKHEIDWAEGNAQILELYKKLIQLRKDVRPLTSGQTVELTTGDPHGMGFLRVWASQQVLVVCNLSDEECAIDLEHELLDGDIETLLERRVLGAERGRNGRLGVRLGPWGYLVANLC